MNRIGRLILNNLNLKVFVPLLILALATTWWGLFHSTARFAELSGGLRFVDMQRGLTPEILFEQFGSYAPDTAPYYLAWSVFFHIIVVNLWYKNQEIKVFIWKIRRSERWH